MHTHTLNSFFTPLARIACLVAIATCMICCTSHPDVPQSYSNSQEEPNIYPDYKDVTIPSNIAPLNFSVRNANEVVARFTYGTNTTTFGEGHKVVIDQDEWKEMLNQCKGKSIKVEVFVKQGNEWTAYKPFNINVAEEEIDPYISYRLIFPSYVAYEMLSISQRNLTNFDETEIYNNLIVSYEADGQCVNCHSYQNYHTNNMQFHMRQGHGGTMIVRNNVPYKIDMKTDSTISAGVYPSWHPTLPIIAYSTNKTGQSFHTRDIAKIEVQDTQSDVIIYDVDKNEIRTVSSIPNEMENFPFWSPDGKYLYYGSAYFEYKDTVAHETEMIQRWDSVQYSIYRRSFDAKSMKFGEPEMVYDAAADSVSATFPRISPDGRYLLVGIGSTGCFHVWHPDADLYLMDLKTKKIRKLENVNSDRAESYHSWSSNGRWIIFISRRDDNNYSRLYIAYFDKQGKAHKAFELPQADPDFYSYFMKSYNIPEFMVEPVQITPQQFAQEAKKDGKKVQYVSSGNSADVEKPKDDSEHTIN